MIIPDGVTSIKDYAFRNCRGLISVTIGDGVTSIGSYAFWPCSELTSVIIGNSLTSIGFYAFYTCSSLMSVTIPNSVTDIKDSVFHNCNSLTSVIFKEKTLAEVQAMANYPWGITDTSIISTWHDASQEWVLEQLSDVGSDFKTETISVTNSIWEVQPNTRAIFNANVSNGDTIILKDYSVDNKY